MKPLQAVILAAGNSRRFQSNKLLEVLPDQTCLLDISIGLAQVLTSNVLLVINDDSLMQEHCRARRYQYVINSQVETGMASSIACGVAASTDAAGWAIL